jgi:predicted patatin/cPLA2 family phospholipase
VHEVLRVIDERVRSGSKPGQRSDAYRLALSIEGGGMRGTVSAGMAIALFELGVVSAFDAVYGSSAGAITGAWLLSSEPPRLRGWADPDYARTLIRWSAMLRGRPVVDVRTLVEEVYQTEFPMDFASVLANPIEYHPLGTDAETGESTDLRPLVTGPAELRLALRASASLPFLAGPPVELGGRRFYDAGVAESIPFRTPLAQGATHVLVLRSRRPLTTEAAGPQPDDPDLDDGELVLDEPDGQPGPLDADLARDGDPARDTNLARGRDSARDAGLARGRDSARDADLARGRDSARDADLARGRDSARDADPAHDGDPTGNANTAKTRRPPRSSRILTRTALRHESLALRTALLTRPDRTAADVARITLAEVEGSALAIYPPPSVPPVSRLTTDPVLLTAALESGRQAARATFAG